jgi:hypothetical protein
MHPVKDAYTTPENYHEKYDAHHDTHPLVQPTFLKAYDALILGYQPECRTVVCEYRVSCGNTAQCRMADTRGCVSRNQRTPSMRKFLSCVYSNFALLAKAVAATILMSKSFVTFHLIHHSKFSSLTYERGPRAGLAAGRTRAVDIPDFSTAQEVGDWAALEGTVSPRAHPAQMYYEPTDHGTLYPLLPPVLPSREYAAVEGAIQHHNLPSQPEFTSSDGMVLARAVRPL